MTLRVAKTAHASNGVRHRVVKHVDEAVRRFRRSIGRRGERSDNRNGYLAGGDLSERLTRRPRRGHAVGDDAIDGSSCTRQRDAEAASHESSDPAITRPMPFRKDEETHFAAVDSVDCLDQGPQLSASEAGPLRDERKSCKSRERRNRWNSAPVSFASRNDSLGTSYQREANRDVEDRLMVHHHDAAFPRNGAVNREPDAADHASHPKYCSSVESQPRTDDCSTIAR